MASNADSAEFFLKLTDGLSPVATREAAALRQLETALRASSREVDRLAAASTAQAAKVVAAEKAMQAATGRQGNVVGDLESRLGAARRRVAELSNSGTPPAMLVKAKEQAADLAAALEQARAKLAGIDDSKLRSEQKSLAAAKLREAGERSHLAALERARPAWDAAAKAAEAAHEKKEAYRKGLSAIGGPMQGITQRLADFREAMGSSAGRTGLLVAGLGILAIAIVVLTVAVAAAVIGFIKMGLGMAGAARDARILAGALTGSSGAGSEFTAIVNQLAREVPMAKAQIAELAREMSLMKLARRDLQAGLTAVAIVSSAIGDSAGGAVKSLVQQVAAMRRFTLGARDMWGEFTMLAGTGLKKADVLGALAKQLGVSAQQVELMLLQGRITMAQGLKALEEAARTRFGKTIAAQMLSVDTQLTKAKENFARLFDGIDLEPALNALGDLLSILDDSTVSGRALKFLLTEGLQAVVNILAVGGPIARAFFYGMMIAALRFYIAVKPVYNQVKEFFDLKPGDGLQVALIAGAVLFGVLATAAAIAGIAMLLAFLPFIIIGAIIYFAVSRIIDIIEGAAGAFTNLRATITSAFSGLSLSDIGANLINSFITSIQNGAGRVSGAMTAMIEQAKSAAKAALGIASPSKWAGQLADFTTAGFVGRLDVGADESADAMQRLVTPDVNIAAPAMAGGGGPIINFYGPVTIGGGESKEAFADWLRGRLRASRSSGAAEDGT